MAQYSSGEIVQLLDQWKDPNLIPSDINQPEEYKQLRTYFIQNHTASSQFGTSEAVHDPSLGSVFMQGLRSPMAPMAETAQLIGWDDTADWLKGAGEPDEGYGQEGGEFIEALRGGDFSGMAENILPAIAEQSGQLLGSIGTRVAGAGLGMAAGAGIGSIVPGAGTAAGAALGGLIGSFGGPFIFEAIQIVGPNAYSLAKQRGKPEPDWSDISQALVTASASGALNSLGANMLPGGAATVRSTVGSFLGNVTRAAAGGVAGETVTEGLQGLVQQAGETAFTPEGLRLDPIAALGEGIIGGGAGGGASIATSAVQETLDPMRAADTTYIRDLMGKEAGRRGYTAEEEVLGPQLDAKTGALLSPTEAYIHEGTQRVAFDPNVILEYATTVEGKPTTKREAKNRILNLMKHEADWHGSAFTWFETGRGTAKGVDTLNKYVDNFYENNKDKVDTWLATDGKDYTVGESYAGNTTNQTKEYIATQIAEGSNASAIMDMLRRIRLFLRQQFKGFDFSATEVSDIISSARRASMAAKLTPTEARGATLEARDGGPIDPSRRKFMKQVGGAAAGAALDPSILLEPATAPAVEAPMYTGMTERYPGSVYEFSIATDPDAGWTSSDDPSEGAMDVAFTHDPNTNEVTVYEGDEVVDTFEVDDMHADAEVLEYVRDRYGRESINDSRVQREEMDRDPETGEGAADYWGDSDERFDNMAASLIRGEKTMAGVERVERGPAYDYFDEPETPRAPEVKAPAIEQPRQKALPAPEETTEKTDAELYVETIDEIMSIYDDDATAAEAAADGTLNDRIISYAVETPFTREELWDGVNERIEALEDTEPTRLESRVRKPKSETIQRDINNTASKTRAKITKLDVEDSEKNARRSMLKRLGKVMGNPARKRGVEAGDQDVFDEHAQNILDGNLEEVETFIAPFEEQMGGRQERDFKAQARRDQRAKRLGKTDAEILKYRAKGDKHPMEGRMTYPFAQEEINRQEEAGEITPEEAEIRRLAVNNVRRVYAGKAGPTVKRTITEATYGIGNYEDLVPWSEVYTEEQTVDMEERAEIAQAEATRTRYDPTDITEKQKQDLLKDPVMPEEAAWIASDQMPNLTGSEERLLFLRAPTEFKSEAEQKEFQTWRRNQRDFDAAEYKRREREARDTAVVEAEKEGKVTRLPPADTQELQKESRRTLEQVDPSVFDTMVTEYGTDYAKALEQANIDYDQSGNLIREEEGEVTSGPNVVDNAKLEKRVQLREKTETDIITGRGLHEASSLKLAAEAVTSGNEQSYFQVIGSEDHPGFKEGLVFFFRPSSKTTYKPRTPYVKWGPNKIETFERAQERLEDLGKPKPELSFDDIRRREDLALSSDEGRAHHRAMGTIQTKINKLMNWDPNSGEYSPKREHIDNLTPRVRETGEIAEQDRGKSEIDNLVFVPKYIHDIKSKFEAIMQSAAPYKDIQDLYNNGFFEGLSEKDALKEFGITESDAKAVADFRTSIKEALPQDGSVDSGAFLKAYMEAMGLEYSEQALELTEKESNALSELARVMARQSQEESKFIRNADEISKGATAGPVLFSRVDSKRVKDKGKTYSEHFNDSFWYRATSFLWGKPVQAIRDFNKIGRFGSERADIEAADKIADLFQRHQSSTKRAAGMETGTDFVQDVSLRTGEFYSKLSKIFAEATDRLGVLTKVPNGELVDFLAGKEVKFSDPAVKKAAEQLRDLMDGIYKYAKEETADLKSPLDLKGEGDSLLPRVWNIEYLATRQGKAKLLKTLSDRFSEKEGGKPIFEDADITIEDMYDIIINSGGFVQGDWTNLKADQTRSESDIEKDMKIQEYLDMLDTETLIDAGIVLDDLQAVIPRFIQKAVERTEYAKRFGTNDEILRGLIDEGIQQIREHNREVLKLKKDAKLSHIDEKRFAKAAWDMARIARNKYGYDMANMPTRKWMQRATNAATIMKLPLVALASMPEFFTPMLKGDVRPDKWFVDLMAATTWAGYKGANGISKLLFNKHLPAMRKMSAEIGGSGILRDIQLLREMGIADIQAMGDLVSTRYANPNFARGGLRAGAGGSLAGKIPKHVRGAFNMQTFMQATMLTTMTEMQQLMALRNFQRHVSKRIDFVQGNKGKTLSGRKARIFKQYTQDLLDYGITGDIDLKTSSGEAAFNAGALRFIDQVITRPNDATTAKAFKNPLIAPLFLFKRFITTFGNTLLTSVGNDMATKVDNVERAKMVGKVGATAMAMYGAVMFSEIIRGAIRGDLDDEDFEAIPGDFNQFVRRLDRTGLLSAPGTMAVNLAFPYKRGWWDSTQARMVSEALGPLGGDLTTFGDTLIDPKKDGWKRLLGQMVPMTKPILKTGKGKKKRKGSGSLYR